MKDLPHAENQIHYVTNFQELVSTPYKGIINAMCWTRTLKGDFGDYYRNLYKTIREGAALSETPEQAHNVIRLIELAFESSDKKQSVPVTGLL